MTCTPVEGEMLLYCPCARSHVHLPVGSAASEYWRVLDGILPPCPDCGHPPSPVQASAEAAR